MLYPQLEENLCNARRALDAATSENVIDLCRQYLARLADYRRELYRLPRTLDLDPKSSSSPGEEVKANRKAARAAIERTAREREWAEGLLLSFTAVSGYGAVETLNRQRHKGRGDWKLSAGGANSGDGGERMTVQEAVETASLLRREEHVARNAASEGAGEAEQFSLFFS